MTSTASYLVASMTCGHCVSAVTEEIVKLAGVHDVSIDLVAGGTSTVTVVSEAPLVEGEVRDAVDEAGYELTGTAG